MYKEYNFYLFNNLLLDEDVCKKLRISKAIKYELLPLIDNSKRVLKQESDHIVIAENLAVKNEILNDTTNRNACFYINMKQYIILINTQTYYGILCNDELVSVYDNMIIRDTKLKLVNIHGFNVIMSDVIESQEKIASISTQIESSEDYQKLKSFNRHLIDYYS